MSALAEDSLQPVSKKQWLLRAVIALVVIALVAALAIWLRGLGSGDTGHKRQVAKISILPDTPPPPPPPPKEEKKPEPPKDEPKQAMRDEPPKPEAPKAANEPLKMEGAAGDGPSAFAAGNVKSEYQGGTPNTGAPAAGGTPADRAQERLYANNARQLLRDEIEKRLKSESAQLTATFSIWLAADGAIQRFELLPSGDAKADAEMQAALNETSRLFKLPPPPHLTLPMRFRLSVRPAA
ncbi:MAG: TonB C-terminal domain-containing protein [Burkholderiaceae bacterium]|nr:TonB C-terminal domain-containing protein [Burkholderiaceae bacterium]